MLENEQRIEHTIAEEKEECPTGYLLGIFFSRQWRPSTKCSIVSPAEQFFFFFFFSSSVCARQQTEQKIHSN
jgi:hypothetical protein